MKNTRYFASLIFIALIPILVSTIIIFAFHGKFILDFHLVVESIPENSGILGMDEVYQWHQIETFSSVGFNGGYYSLAENTANLDFFRFYAWGPFPSIFYGSIASIIGFNESTIILINIILLFLAIASLGYFIRLTPIQFLMLGIILAVFPNIILYLPSALMEMLNLLVAIVLSIIFYKLIHPDNQLTTSFILISLFWLLLAGLFRISWVVVYVPAFSIAGWKLYGKTGVVIGFILSCAVAVTMYLIFGAIAAPYDSIVSLSAGAESVITAIIDRMKFNFANLFFGLSFWILLRFVMFIILVSVSYQGILLLTKKSDLYTYAEVAFHLINIAGIVCATFALYWFVEGRDFRTIGPHVLLSIIVLILFKRYRTVLPIIMIFILGFPNMLQTHYVWTEPHYDDAYFDYEAYQNNLEEHGILYIDSENGWCNTVLFTSLFQRHQPYIQGLQGGLALSEFSSVSRYTTHPQAKFLLLDDETASQLPSHWQLEQLMNIPLGTFYRNLNSACP